MAWITGRRHILELHTGFVRWRQKQYLSSGVRVNHKIPNIPKHYAAHVMFVSIRDSLFSFFCGAEEAVGKDCENASILLLT
jgi:hypothetical protein